MNRRIVCWVGDAPNHRALVAKIAARYPVAGVLVDRKKALRSKSLLKALPARILQKIRFGKIDAAWSSLQAYYREQYPAWPDTKCLFTDAVNSEEALRFTKELNPDLVIVSGTSLVKEPMVSLPVPLGIMNLHTGLSPYVKGGPNCTNWCIANGQWGLIGNTIMWLSAGIDSGNIIASEITDTDDVIDLGVIHRMVMEHAHDLYLRTIEYVLHSSPPFQSVPQASLGKGQLYLTRMWGDTQKAQLLKNLRLPKDMTLPFEPRTLSLPS